MMVQLAAALEDLAADGGWPAGKGLILSAARNSSNVFCSGGDLATVRQIMTHEQAVLRIHMMFFGLPDTHHPDPLIKDMDPDPSLIKQK
jgi:hypothetical protein